jgi:DNA replicative helicase MCM subunit Mcm2 (Cdc46/Mcm family)
VSLLASRLSANHLPPLSPPHLKQYIQHARVTVHPKLSEEARALIKAFYLQMRASAAAAGNPALRRAIPVTARHLEALVRLSVAKARCELRALVTAQDATDAIALVKYALSELFNVSSCSSGARPNSTTRNSTGKGAQLKRFISELQSIVARTGDPTLNEEQLRQVHSTLQLSMPFADLVESLNHSGFLLRRGQGYKVLASAV